MRSLGRGRDLKVCDCCGAGDETVLRETTGVSYWQACGVVRQVEMLLKRFKSWRGVGG